MQRYELNDNFIVLYDGVCGLCSHLIQFVAKRDQRRRFRFAALQSSFARGLLRRHSRDPEGLDTLYLVIDAGSPSERLLMKTRALLLVIEQLGGGWKAACVLRVLPASLLDMAYDVLARARYRVFGKYDTCLVPASDLRERFIEAE
ncbi:MAG: DCC1-like thiol-disulfide oxidoreductase family protein [Acidobacteriota bacterium]